MSTMPRQVKDDGDAYVQRYRIIEYPNGFFIDGADCIPVTIELHPYYLAIQYARPFSGKHAHERFGFYEFHAFLQRIAEILMMTRVPSLQACPNRRDVYERAVGQTARVLNKRVHLQWQQLLQRVETKVLDVHRAIFAATRRCSLLAFQAELYQDPYLVHDITKYRAAAIAARFACNYIDGAFWSEQGLTDLFERWRDQKQGRYSDRLSRFAPKEQALLVQAFLSLLHNWLGMFSPNLKPYRSLNKTLMQLPAGVPLGLISNLTRVYLPRPLLERTELIVVTYLAERRVSLRNRHVFCQARDLEIKEAMRRVALHTHNDLSPRRTQDLIFMVNFLADYPGVHRGKITGLAKKCIRWCHDRRTARQLPWCSLDTHTARPPIPLPNTPGVTFLDTVEAICEEGKAMRHCIASYAQGAVDGHHYLFHVTHEGEHATVQVDAYTGKVLQAHGPHNQRNNAVTWGTRVLNQWGRQWPQGSDL